VPHGAPVLLTEDWLRRNGHLLAADARAAAMRTARIRLDRLLHGGPVSVPGAVPRTCQPSSYSLTHAELAAHIRDLRRSGWQCWEISVRFDFGTVTRAA
jgi:hypothetical protein